MDLEAVYFIGAFVLFAGADLGGPSAIGTVGIKPNGDLLDQPRTKFATLYRMVTPEHRSNLEREYAKAKAEIPRIVHVIAKDTIDDGVAEPCYRL
jgi:hypothetical protein